MKNRAMLIGSIGAGKSTLTNALLGKDVEAYKTQTLTYYDWIVDTPGEYTENPLFYKSIMATALEVTHVFYLQDATNGKMIFPHGFSSGISKLPIGVITKSDHAEANLPRSLEMLRQVVTHGPIVITSALEKKGVDHLRELVKFDTMESIEDYVENQRTTELLFNKVLYK
ncbi:ethanolamine utilization protein EutP [Planococcus donghaensis MPA1U2]|uniref:Ethanolamine utilization protein EutP n=1 Tax=Planococcus donghaensis MPA1U2 TaxID=933115 RepID=E7RHY0_9BACL|nr:EutP/PduV family microcompartment system protein [Planococcus donghaensis]EGA89410.1 ethanolamine utilization protein EutP [Planococcus donghaensis MPA1U2]